MLRLDPFSGTAFVFRSKRADRIKILVDRATLGNWSGRACFHLQPIADHMRRHLAMADRLFMDETTAPVLDPGRGQTGDRDALYRAMGVFPYTLPSPLDEDLEGRRPTARQK